MQGLGFKVFGFEFQGLGFMVLELSIEGLIV